MLVLLVQQQHIKLKYLVDVDICKNWPLVGVKSLLLTIQTRLTKQVVHHHVGPDLVVDADQEGNILLGLASCKFWRELLTDLITECCCVLH